MSTHIGIGFSNHGDVETAAKDAAFDAKIQNDQNQIELGIIFCTVQYDLKSVLPVVQAVLNTDNLIGASTSGVILSDGTHSKGIGIIAITSEGINFSIGQIDEIRSRNPQQAGSSLAHSALRHFGDHTRQLFLFFVDGQLENNSFLLKGLQEVFGNAFSIVGGGSCDDFRYKESYQIYKNQIFENSAVGLLLGGQATVGIGGRHGWRPLGKPRKITKSENNIIHTINGQKASYIYEDYFGQESKNLMNSQFDQMSILYPLGIFIDRTNEYLLRNVFGILPDGSILCQGAVPQGAEVHIMIGNKESCKQAAIKAAQEAQNGLGGLQPSLLIILESMVRQKLFGRYAYQEINEIKNVFGDVPIIGMYTHGEIYPFQDTENMKKIHTQNESIVILAIR